MASTSEDPYPWQEPESPVTRGAFIVVEGLDRAGKTTQVSRLCSKLHSIGHNIKTLRFPDRTSPTGQMINAYLQSQTPMDDHAIHLLFSANRWEKARWIEETLLSGYTVVCDRYYHSGAVYSAAKALHSLSLSWAKTPDIGLPKPDMVIFLDLDQEVAEQRGGYGDEKYEKKEMQMRVRGLFKEMLGEGDGMVVMIDAGKSMEAVGEEVVSSVLTVVPAVEHGAKGKEIEKFLG